MKVSKNTIAPWLSVSDTARALKFYETAFGAAILERLEDEPGRVEVAQLSVNGATFWIQQDAQVNQPTHGGESAVRMLIITDNPDAAFTQAIGSGAREIAGMHEEYGWRSGRIVDPFGHDWEFCRKVN
jgi:PhnB protein